MKFHLIYISSVSACFELENDSPYYAQTAYNVEVNGETALNDVRTNVFSLFDLCPDTEYRVSIGESAVSVRTKSETACISAADFGTVHDGVTDDTTALQTAIFACPIGGRVRIDAGTYFIRPLVLKSDITVELCEGAVLLGDTEPEHYPVWPGEIVDPNTGKEVQVSSFEGTPMACHQSFISAHRAKNIAIVGRGVIDGNAQNSVWWINPKERKAGRPRLFFCNDCENIVFHGITGRNSASWNFHPYFSKNIGFYDMAVEAPKDSPNTDGTDPESCDGVNYIGVRFSVGDDAIAIKAGKMYMGMKYQRAATNHVIRNCLMEYAHGAVVLGSEMSGGVRDLTVSQCLFCHTDRGLRIKTRRGRGKYAVIDGVEFSNIHMDNVLSPLVINMYYFCDVDGKSEYVQDKTARPVDDGTPYLGRFVFRDIRCENYEYAAGYFHGLPEQPIDSVEIDNVTFTAKPDAGEGFPAMMCDIEPHSKAGLRFINVKNVKLNNVTIEGQDGDRVTIVGGVVEEN